MIWQEYHVVTTSEHVDELTDQLTSLGAVAVTLQDSGDQPIFEPQPETIILWPETTVTGLFEESTPSEPIIHFLENEEALGRIQHFHLEQLADEDWERRCLEGFEPLYFGHRLWICPSWKKPPDPNAINIILDPGLAFGTGSHPTTQLCLEWLDSHINNQEWVIDYGCGSGILAIAALKLGARAAIAIDNDPQALEATQANAERNNIPSTLNDSAFSQMTSTPLIIQNPERAIPVLADVIMANILAKPLIKFVYFFSKQIKSGGTIVLSGILTDQVDALLEAYSPWFTMTKPIILDHWVLLEGVRKDSVRDKILN